MTGNDRSGPADDVAAGGPTAYVHAGMFKTGTTAIQAALVEAKAAALADGLVYPDAYGANHSHVLSAVFRPEDAALGATLRYRGLAHLWDGREAIGRELDRLFADAACRGCDVLLSGEELSAFPRTALAALREALAAHFERVVVLVLVRPPRSFARSAAQQVVRVRLTLPGLVADPPLPLYEQRLRTLGAVFGPQNLRARVFARDRLVADCPLQTVLSMLRRPLPHLSQVRAPRANVAMSMTAAKVMSALNTHLSDEPTIALPPSIRRALLEGPAGTVLRAALAEGARSTVFPIAVRRAVIGIPGPPFVLPREVALSVERAVGADARFVSALLGEDVDALDERAGEGAPSLDECARFAEAEVDATLRHLAAHQPSASGLWHRTRRWLAQGPPRRTR